MSENNIELHSTAVLIKASIIAALAATMLFITIILPAEFNKDPLGTGKFLGLTVLSAPAKSLPKAPVKNAASNTVQTDDVKISVPAGRGIEYKFQMMKYADLKYEWKSDGEQIYFDFHGEPKGGAAGYFKSYAISTASAVKGTMTAPFDGSHGWYWKNNSDKDIIITLKTSGIYTLIGNPKKE